MDITKKIEIYKKYQRELETKQRQQEVRLKEIHDFLKNNEKGKAFLETLY